jgi:hypothetical protein
VEIEAVTTCVGENCLRMLELTSKQNRRFFDNYIVVTAPTDIQTQNFCKYSGLTCIVTDAFYKYGFKFNKGAAINVGFSNSRYFDYLLHIDSDIFIPDQNFRQVLEKELTDRDYMYGSCRVIVETKRQLDNLIAGKINEDELISYPGICYGFFQLHNVRSQIVRRGAIYPEIYEKGESDWRWRNLWGDLANKDTEIVGSLKKLSVNVWHLGLPDIAGSETFWK